MCYVKISLNWIKCLLHLYCMCMSVCCVCVSVYPPSHTGWWVPDVSMLRGCLAPAPRPSIWKQLGTVTSAGYGTLRFSTRTHAPAPHPHTHIHSALNIFTEHAYSLFLFSSLLCCSLLHTLISYTHSLQSAWKLRQRSIPHFSMRHQGWLTPNSISCPFFPWKTLVLI